MGIPYTSVVLILIALLFVQEVHFCCSMIMDSSKNISCLESERKALVKFSQSLVDESNRLSSWVGDDCCTWHGVGCSKRTSHVVKLDLRHNPTSFDFEKYINDGYYPKNYSRACLGGEINPSLLNLTHLHYLDLSFNNFSGIRIPEFLGSLKNLRYLNLSFSNFGGEVPHRLGNLSSLQYLDLSNIVFTNDGNNIPSTYQLTSDSLWWASMLSSVENLDLAGVNLQMATNWLHAINMLPSLSVLNLASCGIESIPSLSFVNFTSLVSLHLQWNHIDSTIPLWLSNISSLRYLHLAGNSFHTPVPDSTLGKLNSLTVLDLSNNAFDTSFPNSLCNLSGLVHMDLSYNKFEGPIPRAMGNLKQLTNLDLSFNEFGGEIPNTVGSLCNLHMLNLSYNKFSRAVSSFVGNSYGCLQNSLKELNLQSNVLSGFIPNELAEFKNLEYLLLSRNSFFGPIPASLGRLPSLRDLQINDNKLSGSIPTSIGQLSNLENLDVSHNSLSGSIPTSIGQLSNLEKLDVSHNSLSGMVFEHHFAQLRRLNELDMSSNSLVLNVSSQWVPPFQLRVIAMGSCKLGRFPVWLRTQNHVEELTISNASISDTIPDWFESLYPGINHLDLSKNQIGGKLPKFQELNEPSQYLQLKYLSLYSNKFEGPLAPFPSNVFLLDVSDNLLSGHIPLIDDNLNMQMGTLILSNNHLTGGLPTFLCNVTTLQAIDLSNNQLSGRLPSCLGNLQGLIVLDITNNSLYGRIPISLGSLQGLKSLHLHNNRFHGKLPVTLQNLTSLITFDLGGNDFTDIIPHWIGENLSKLQFLSLGSNKFYGIIPFQLCHLPSLQFLSLAQNNITGSIPPCFGNFTGMVYTGKRRGKDYSLHYVGNYDETISDSINGKEIEYVNILAYLITSLDLSNNNIVGKIPKELMNLSGLVILNVAGNHLKGSIPETIGNLKRLESLDLSSNQLSGSIPPSLSDLNFLRHLNLSFNNLSGRIPAGNQLQTLNDQSIYMGNSELCGAPLLKSCLDDDKSSAGESKGGDDTNQFEFYAATGPGFVVGFLGICSILYFKNSWRYAYFNFLYNNIYNKLLVIIAVKAIWLRRKFYKG